MNAPQQRPAENAKSSPLEPRFFVAPRMDERLQDIFTQYRNSGQKREKRKKTMQRFAAYIRISSEEQVGNYSVEAQKRAIQAWVQAQDGQLVQMYVDEGQSGRTTERPE